eukprot:scaffold1843_cov107-Skeletonema_dohrnii-CCMP3373.AAC.8
MSSSTILCGHMKAETRLPTPLFDDDKSSSDEKSSSNRLSLLEGTILTWTKQIKSVLKQDPEAQLKLGMHPTPDVEIAFWKKKSNNLNSIFEQLQSPEIRRILRVLDEAQSTYCTAFARLCKEVYSARLEANDNVKHLRPLEKWINKLNEEDFGNLTTVFKPMLHILMLIWKHSKHYNTPNRLVVLVQEMCNSIIDQAHRSISGEQIFSLIDNEEANVAVEELSTVLKVCGKFKKTYLDYKARVANECDHEWNVHNGALFARLDCFMERCHDVLDMTQTIIQFSKLAKVEIGGTKGTTLTATIQQIKNDFQDSVDAIKNLEYDIMDIQATQFDSEYSAFRKFVKEIERRLGAVIGLALDDCETIYGRFQLVDMFDRKLLERPIIQDEVEVKQIRLIQSYGKDLKIVQDEFIKYRSNPPKDTMQNLPPIGGSLTWCRGLLARASIPMEKMKELDRNILDREEAKEVIKVQKAIVSTLLDYERQKIEEWGGDVDATSSATLGLPLLQRSEVDRHLVTNFDPALVRLLREVKYFLLLEIPVPDSALQIFQLSDTFRAWTGNLDLIVGMNNSVLSTMIPVEKPLVVPYLEKFDLVVQPGLETLNWQSPGVEEFIRDSMEQVKIVHGVLKTMQDNLSTMKDIIAQWERPMIERKTKPMEKEEFERTFKSLCNTNYAEITESGNNIHHVLEETNKVLHVSSTESTDDWRCYIEFVNDLIVQGLSASAMASLQFLVDQIDPVSIQKERRLPLFEIELDLNDSDGLNFQPPLGNASDKTGMSDLIDSIVGSIFHISTLFKRVDSDGTYMAEIQSDAAVSSVVSALSNVVAANDEKCLVLQKDFDKYSHLWTTDLKSYFKDFCEDATIVTEHGSNLLDLSKFEEAIQKCIDAQTEVVKAKSPVDIGWLRINVTPAKRQVSIFATKWINMYTSHMRESIINTLTDLHDFMQSVTNGLKREITEENNNDELMAVMTVIRDVRKKMESVPELFGPQKECVQILRRYGVDVLNDEVAGKKLQDFLEEIPLAWDAVVKKTFRKKEDILPMQMAAVDSLKVDLDQFYLSIREYRGDFRANAPFKFEGGCDEAFTVIDSFSKKLDEIEVQVDQFRELEDLFELQPTAYVEIGETRSEIKQLTLLWEFKQSVDDVFQSWRKELWADVNT